MKPKRIRLFSKHFCSWCQDAAAWLDQRGLAYEKIDLGKQPAAAEEMYRLSNQRLVPVIEVDGHVLADFDTAQLEAFWKKLGYE
jgi:glutaredoxin